MAARKRRVKGQAWVDKAPCLPESTYPGYSRREMRACVIDHAIKPAKRSQGKPWALLTMGVPGTGKSTIAGPILKGKSYVCSCPDEVKEQLPEFLAAISKRAKNAGTIVQKESVTIASQVADRAVRERKNLLIDGTGAILSKYKKVIRRLKREGYRVEVVGVHAPLPVVQKRIASRAKATGRHVPMAAVKWYDGQVPCNFLPVAQLADKFSLYDVGGKKPRPVLLTRNGRVVKEDRRELAKIVSKCALPGGGKKRR